MDNNSILSNIIQTLEESPLAQIKDSIDYPQIADMISKVFKPYHELANSFHANIDSILPALKHISEVSNTYRAVEKMGENQYVLISLVPQELIDKISETETTEIIDTAIEYYLEDNTHTQKTIDFISNKVKNHVFEQAKSAFVRKEYDLAIIGLTAVLDRLLSECSEQIKNYHIESRVKVILQNFEEKGDFFLSDLEARDYALYLTYEKALGLFGANSYFTDEEPPILNRHWIMHGRTNRKHGRLDCIKVFNMIYGTIRMNELGKKDQECNN